MKNIEKYKDEIKSKIKEKSTLDCAIADLRGNACDECFRCTDCGLKSLDWLLEEYKKPLLTDEGIKFLKEHIKQSGAIAVYIKITKKVANYYEYRLEIHLETGLISIPFVEKSNLYEMFKNMEIGVSYAPEDLGL
jgi:hypothetical protein